MKKPKVEKTRLPAGLPDDETLLKALQSQRELDLSDLARMYGLKGEDRRLLRQRLKALVGTWGAQQLQRCLTGGHG